MTGGGGAGKTSNDCLIGQSGLSDNIGKAEFMAADKRFIGMDKIDYLITELDITDES